MCKKQGLIVITISFFNFLKNNPGVIRNNLYRWTGVSLQYGSEPFYEKFLNEFRSGAAEGGGWGEEFRRTLASEKIMKSKLQMSNVSKITKQSQAQP